MMPNQKKHQFFISSTYTDLVKERDAVMKAILSLYQIPIGMEMFSAGDDEQWETIKRTIDSSDYYILILGERYGSVSNSGIGFTEMEYDYAISTGIPVYSFVKKDGVATVESQRETKPKFIKKFTDFRSKVLSNNKMADFWETVEGLSYKVSISVVKAMAEKPRVGWIKGSTAMETTSEELAKLSNENRALRDEISKLRADISKVQIPVLDIIFSAKMTDLNYYVNPLRWLDKIDERKIDGRVKSAIPPSLIAKFNNLLENESEEIVEYKKEYNRIYNLKANSQPLILKVTNSGTVRATDIHIDIQLPDFVFIRSNDYMDSAAIPNPPIEIDNPVEEAYAKFSAEASAEAISFFRGMSVPINKRRSYSIKTTTSRHTYKPSENKLEYRIGDIIQTRSVDINENIVVVPQKPGQGEIVITMICNEMTEVKTISIPVYVKSSLESQDTQYDLF